METDTVSVLSPVTGWICLAIFGTAWIVIGILLGRKASNLEGYLLAGRNVGMALGAATAMATWVTSNTVMLAPAFALKAGIWGMVAYCTASFGLFLFAPVTKRIHQILPKGFTSGDFVRIRYGRKAWILFLVITIIYSMAWLVSMGIAGGILLHDLAGIPYVWGMSVILFVCVAYTLFGGLYAVIGTDFVQSVIILIGVALVGWLVIDKGGLADSYQHVETHSPMLMKVMLAPALLSLFNNLFFGLGEVFHNNVWWSRAYALRKDVAPKAFALAGFLWLPIPIAAGFIALSAGPLGINVTDPNTAGPVVAGNVLGQAGAVLVFIVVFCSLASSVDSLLAATSDLMAEDIYRRLFNPRANDATVRKAALFSVLGLGAVTWMLCAVSTQDILLVLFLSGGLVASTIWPIILGLYWKRTSREAAFYAMLSGSVLGVVAYFQIGWFSGALVGAVVSMAVVLIGTKLRSEEPFDWNRLPSEDQNH